LEKVHTAPHRLPLPGQAVWIRRQRWQVERAFSDRQVVHIAVVSRTTRRTFLAPFDGFRSAERDARRYVRRQSAAARAAGVIARTPDARLPMAMLDADVSILPHQIEPALAVLAGWARLLIADEVGLGKTIQAGLIVAELGRRQIAPRVLILTPASLREQWQAELAGRFSIACLPADRQGLDALARAGVANGDPWRQPGVWLASADFLKQAHVAAALPSEPWDLVVIDEAHTVCGDSERYAACQSVARRARRVVLLTATPHSGDETRYSRLLEIGRMDSGDERMLVFRRTRAGLGMARARRVRWHHVSLNPAESRVLDELRTFEQRVLRAAGTMRRDGALMLLAVFRKRSLSTFAALSRSLARRMTWLESGAIDSPPAWRQSSFDFGADDSEDADGLTVITGLGRDRELAWLRRLQLLARVAARHDSKVARLESLIARTAEPVVVFSEFRHSLEAVERRLRRSRAIAVLHGGLDQEARRAQLRDFLAGPANVLLATDVAGQGLNLHSRCRWVISLELPWNPARLEQRLGRVDRLGQTRAPHLTLLVARHPAETGLLSHLARRVVGAQRSFAPGALQDVAPPEVEVRTALLSAGMQADTREREEQHVTRRSPELCTHWRRQALIMARALERRRALARRWRAPAADTPRVLVARTPRSKSALLLCSVPVLDGLGCLLERIALVVRVGISTGRKLAVRDIAPLIRSAADRMMCRRLRKLSLQVGAASSRTTTRDALLAARHEHRGSVREAQPGLFDGRALRQFEAEALARERVERQWRQRADANSAATVLRLGDADVEIVLASE
jgi:superfamily II DNA or RNA helicase